MIISRDNNHKISESCSPLHNSYSSCWPEQLMTVNNRKEQSQTNRQLRQQTENWKALRKFNFMFYSWLPADTAIVNKVSFKKFPDPDCDSDPGTLHPDYEPDRHQNLNDCALGHLHHLQKISSKSIHNFLSTHNTLCSTQPAYLHSLLNYHTPTRSLRSANANLLSVPRVRTTFASRDFSVAASAIWNSLPSGIRDSSSTHTFRRLLKTHCFQQAFGSP